MEMKKTLGIGLVGAGFMGKTHLYAIRNLPFFFDTEKIPFDASVRAVCASTPTRSAGFADRWGIPRASTLDEMLTDPAIHVIDVCSPNQLHFDTIRRALAAGKHVLCEKPLCVTTGEADELVRLAKNSGLICGMVFNNRYLAPVMRAKQLIDQERLGRILSFEFTYRHNSCIDPDRRVGWKQTASAGGGTLADLGPHVIDLCHLLCGKLTSVSARRQIAFPTHLAPDGSMWETDADEAFYLISTTESGAVGTITVSKLVQGANDELTFAIHGSKGSLSFSLMDMNYLNFYDATAQGAPMGGVRGYTRIECVGRYPEPASSFPSFKAPAGWLRGHTSALCDYLSAVATGQPASPSFEDGAYVQYVMDAARRSARERREVPVC